MTDLAIGNQIAIVILPGGGGASASSSAFDAGMNQNFVLWYSGSLMNRLVLA